MFKEEVLKILKKENISEELLQTPPSPEMGDYALPCFTLAKEYKKAPQEIAKDLEKRLKATKNIEKIQAQGPYLNFFINKKELAKQTIQKVLKEKEKYGQQKLGKGKKILIDCSSPNIAKPFGIGHLRSTIIGNSLAEIHKKLGYKVIKINYLGDWGTQFGKLITGYKHFGNPKLLKKDPINHLLELYVKVNQDPSLEEESRKWFKKLEDGDKEALKLWKEFKEYSLKDFNEMYKIFHIHFEWISGESFYNTKMETVFKELQKKKLLEESEGAYIVNLEKYNLGVCLIKKSDGAALYATRDIAAAIDRYKKYKFEKMLYEVGSEQKLHFKQFFKVLELMGHTWAKDCIHVEHGLYLDKDGKKFATRKGKTVFMKDIVNETISLVKKTIEEKNPKLKNKEEIARMVAVAAFFYGDLKSNRAHDMIFDLDKFIEFEGNTGPYIQYTHARAASILRKAGKYKVQIQEGNTKEQELIRMIAAFPETIQEAQKQLSPHIIATYTFTLAQTFNDFYHSCPVLTEQEPLRSSRLALVEASKITLANSLSLLGIQAPEEM